MEYNVSIMNEGVKVFMEIGGQPVLQTFTEPGYKLGQLRYNLISEEVNELWKKGLSKEDHIETLDAMVDILYVVIGMYYTYGFEPQTLVGVADPITPPAKDITFSDAKYIKMVFDDLLLTLMKVMSDPTKVEIEVQNILDAFVVMILHINTTYFGYDLFGAFNEVQESNMSKFVYSEEEVRKSIELRLSETNGDINHSNMQYENCVYEVVNGLYVLKNASTGKILKGMHYFDPDLTPYI